jgi:hypothetical protein
MMKKRIVFVLLLTAGLFFDQPVWSQDQQVSTLIKSQTIEMGRALIRNDLPGFNKFMHPAIIKLSGGPEKMKQLADTAFSVFRSLGGTISKITYGNPEPVVIHQGEWQTTLTQTTAITTSFADISYQSTLLAISPDKSRNWYFIDSSIYPEAQIRKNLPGISPKLVLPPPAKPVITPKEQ